MPREARSARPRPAAGAGGANQHWRASLNGDGPYTPVDVASGRVLEKPGGQTANGTQAEVRDSRGGSDQRWWFT